MSSQALLLLWAFMVLVIYAMMWANSDKIPGVSAVREQLFGPNCPSCNLKFTPDKCHWEKTTQCLDGKDYCATCKVRGMCGC